MTHHIEDADLLLVIHAVKGAMFNGGVPEAVAISGLRWLRGDEESDIDRATLERWRDSYGPDERDR